MLVRITNKCLMGCNHCMINATFDGCHMKMETFIKAIEFTAHFDSRMLFLSGGEPTDHPQFLEMVQIAEEYVKNGRIWLILIASNGLFLDDKKYTEEILKHNIRFQITNDPRFYPKKINPIIHPKICYENNLAILSQMGRALNNNLECSRQSPMCFNLRSANNHFQDFQKTIEHLRIKNKFCTPSINIDGIVVAGESSSCYPLGTVDSTGAELVENLNGMKCGKCGLHKNLPDEIKTLWQKFEGN